MATKVLHNIKEGQILVTTEEAVKLGSELITDDSASTLAQLSELQVVIESKGIRAVAFSNKQPLYSATDLKIPQDELY